MWRFASRVGGRIALASCQVGQTRGLAVGAVAVNAAGWAWCDAEEDRLYEEAKIKVYLACTQSSAAVTPPGCRCTSAGVPARHVPKRPMQRDIKTKQSAFSALHCQMLSSSPAAIPGALKLILATSFGGDPTVQARFLLEQSRRFSTTRKAIRRVGTALRQSSSLFPESFRPRPPSAGPSTAQPGGTPLAFMMYDWQMPPRRRCWLKWAR